MNTKIQDEFFIEKSGPRPNILMEGTFYPPYKIDFFNQTTVSKPRTPV